MFQNVTKLHLEVSRNDCRKSLEFLTSSVDLSKLVEVNLESFCFDKTNRSLLFDIISHLEKLCSLSSLIVHSRYGKYELYPYLKQIFSILPRTIEHLRIPLNQLDQIEIIWERCQNLSVIEFEITRLKFSQEVINWFNQNTINSKFRRQNGHDIVWIGKRINCIKNNCKRMKLSDDQIDTSS